MTARAEGTFKVTSWDESTYQDLDGSSKLTRAKVTFGWNGDLEADSSSDSLMYYREDGTAVYTGLERITGQLAGRSGAFVLRTEGSYSDGEARTSMHVIEGSGTGELAGLRGTGQAVADGESGGRFSLDYDLG
jgi:hypothetical protein